MEGGSDIDRETPKGVRDLTELPPERRYSQEPHVRRLLARPLAGVETSGCADRVAILVQQSRGQMIGVGIYADHTTGPQRVQPLKKPADQGTRTRDYSQLP
jgi:hypothetical protein